MMDPNTHIHELRGKADAFISDLLLHRFEMPLDDLAHSISELAFENDNPLRQLFVEVCGLSKFYSLAKFYVTYG